MNTASTPILPTPPPATSQPATAPSDASAAPPSFDNATVDEIVDILCNSSNYTSESQYKTSFSVVTSSLRFGIPHSADPGPLVFDNIIGISNGALRRDTIKAYVNYARGNIVRHAQAADHESLNALTKELIAAVQSNKREVFRLLIESQSGFHYRGGQLAYYYFDGYRKLVNKYTVLYQTAYCVAYHLRCHRKVTESPTSPNSGAGASSSSSSVQGSSEANRTTLPTAAPMATPTASTTPITPTVVDSTPTNVSTGILPPPLPTTTGMGSASQSSVINNMAGASLSQQFTVLKQFLAHIVPAPPSIALLTMQNFASLQPEKRQELLRLASTQYYIKHPLWQIAPAVSQSAQSTVTTQLATFISTNIPSSSSAQESQQQPVQSVPVQQLTQQSPQQPSQPRQEPVQQQTVQPSKQPELPKQHQQSTSTPIQEQAATVPPEAPAKLNKDKQSITVERVKQLLKDRVANNKRMLRVVGTQFWGIKGICIYFDKDQKTFGFVGLDLAEDTPNFASQFWYLTIHNDATVVRLAEFDNLSALRTCALMDLRPTYYWPRYLYKGNTVDGWQSNYFGANDQNTVLGFNTPAKADKKYPRCTGILSNHVQCGLVNLAHQLDGDIEDGGYPYLITQHPNGREILDIIKKEKLVDDKALLLFTDYQAYGFDKEEDLFDPAVKPVKKLPTPVRPHGYLTQSIAIECKNIAQRGVRMPSLKWRMETEIYATYLDRLGTHAILENIKARFEEIDDNGYAVKLGSFTGLIYCESPLCDIDPRIDELKEVNFNYNGIDTNSKWYKLANQTGKDDADSSAPFVPMEDDVVSVEEPKEKEPKKTTSKKRSTRSSTGSSGSKKSLGKRSRTDFVDQPDDDIVKVDEQGASSSAASSGVRTRSATAVYSKRSSKAAESPLDMIARAADSSESHSRTGSTAAEQSSTKAKSSKTITLNTDDIFDNAEDVMEDDPDVLVIDDGSDQEDESSKKKQKKQKTK